VLGTAADRLCGAFGRVGLFKSPFIRIAALGALKPALIHIYTIPECITAAAAVAQGGVWQQRVCFGFAAVVGKYVQLGVIPYSITGRIDIFQITEIVTFNVVVSREVQCGVTVVSGCHYRPKHFVLHHIVSQDGVGEADRALFIGRP